MLRKLSFVILTIFFLASFSEQNGTYQKEYYDNGRLKSEGWTKNGIKVNYWKFYHPNGKLSEEGHFQNNKRIKYWHFYDQDGKHLQEGHYQKGTKTDWWLFYDSNGKVNHKCQLKNGKKNGYCLKYLDEQLTSAEKYQNGKKVKEWFSFASFKRENNLSDLN
ncbi:toxin-antitoxin system YwqK family antitoxin [Pseudozobellia sp. WGM2]|uniref:toxin-antitoxin system YwqK family antitoxin n=1 Tax=Pseudozobellia sp. WGM2 TaxID=2787625 RepID=UPI001ADF62C9|nr:hypothetical protein [Pseudozobellia sp. WGM2]